MTDIYLGAKLARVQGDPHETLPLVHIRMYGHPKSMSCGELLLSDALTPSQARALGQLLLDEARVAAGDYE